jgi:hypothetical protein
MNKIDTNLENIKNWIKNAPDPRSLNSNDDYMSLWLEIMSYVLYILQVGAASCEVKYSTRRGVSKHRAIIMGMMVRITKLYEGFLTHLANRQIELALIFVRLISETEVKMEYLTKSKNKRKSARSYIVSTYKADKENLKDLKQKAKKRSLTAIENSILSSIKKKIKADNITQKELMQNRIWNIDGKDFRSILQSLNREMEYSYVFGGMSNYVHGTWHDLRIYHLSSRNGRYFPKLDYSIPDPILH